uniref:Uncharacterized protein n=1 Tax=Physcomitrium patens TaxID=3218 RepID=A0A2K1L6V8_PHYPA|nr:hypothetical protein PHYPA_000203 [Physcomitrium patens]
MEAVYKEEEEKIAMKRNDIGLVKTIHKKKAFFFN